MPLPLGDVPITYADLSKSNLLARLPPAQSLKQGLERLCRVAFTYYGISNFSNVLEPKKS